MYFHTPRKCALFGVAEEARSQQVNYICDEASSVGKGANVVISQLHHYLENHGLGQLLPSLIIIIYLKYVCQNNIGEKTLFLHADN